MNVDLQLLGPEYLLDPLVPLYLLSAFLTAGLGAGVLLFERFTVPSRRFFLLTVVMALWMVPLGLVHAAGSPAMQEVWLRAAFVFIPLTLPALYWMAVSVAPVTEGAPAWLPWAGGAAFGAVSLAGPALVVGLESLFHRNAPGLAGLEVLAVLYLLFEVSAIAMTARRLFRARRGALSGKERSERLLLLAAVVVGTLTMLDYGLAADPFRAGWLTPISLPLSAFLVTVTAVRYRMFAPGESFATDEVLRTMSEAVLVTDRHGRVRGSNPAAARLLQRSEGQLLGRAVGEVVGSGNGQWRPWSPTGESMAMELDLRPASGELVRASVWEEPIRFGGRLVGCVLVARDERDRVETERALRASERRYQSLFWNNPGAVYEFDQDGRFVAANPALETLLGEPVDRILGRPFIEIITTDTREDALDVFRTAMAGRPREFEVAVVHSSGARREIRGVAMPIRNPDGEVTGVSGVALDLTEATQAKKELEVQRRYFADLFESSPEGIVLVEAETDRVIRVNEEFTRMFGYSANEAVGRNLNELIVPEGLWDEGQSLNDAARSGGRVRTETRRQRKDGTPVEVSVLARDLRIPGEPDQLYGVYRDIGDRRETERALRQREEELRHAQKLEAVGKLAGGIAHDFNNLLTVINGHARFAMETPSVDEGLTRDLVEIERAGARAASLTQQLLAYSRRQVLHPQPLDPNDVVREVRDMIDRLIGEHIRVETRLTAEAATVHADRGQLQQVLMNLVMNARDAMEEGGTLILETSVLQLDAGDDRIERWEIGPGEYVCLRVSDTGVGMDAETRDQAFEPFFTTKEQGKGTGLGLATVFGIVKQSGGHVSIRSEPGDGTTCEVILPRADAAAPVVEGAGPSEERDPCPTARVLVVEDEPAVRKLVVRVLERDGCSVVQAENGLHALEVLATLDGPVDLIITDLVMPDMGGRELASRVRQDQPDQLVLFMSGYDDDAAAGAEPDSAFIGKPFTPSELTERVSETLSAQCPVPGPSK